jgi:hypothetical protein
MFSNAFSKSLLAVALASVSAAASSATVVFSDFVSANPALFDEASTTVSGDTLTIGLSNFTATATPGALPVGSAFDTFTFKVTAEKGFLISGFNYNEAVNYTTNGGVAVATGSITYNGLPASLGVVIAPNNANGSGGLSDVRSFSGVSELLVVISNSLFAASVGGSASISKSLAQFSISTIEAPAEIPVPAVAWMFGTALVGLVTVGRRASV